MTENKTIENNFTYHAPTATKTVMYLMLRESAKKLAYLIDASCPEGRERALAMTKLEECVMWANAGIARDV